MVGRAALRPASELVWPPASPAAPLQSADCSSPLPRATRRVELQFPRGRLLALGQKHFHSRHQKAKGQKYFDLELHVTNAQRNSLSRSKASFSPASARRNRALWGSHP